MESSTFKIDCFIHLRTHSAYSLSHGAIQISELIDLAVNDLQPAIAVTDINNMFGALEFSETAFEKGIQPIIGSQVTIEDKNGTGEVVLLAKNNRGYQNLIQIVSSVHLESNSTKGPSVKQTIFKSMNEGLIVLTGGIENGYIPSAINHGQLELAEDRLEFLNSYFKDNLYIELQRHGLTEQKVVEKKLIEWALNKNIPLVATNDVCFEDPSMKEAHDVLLCIDAGKTISNPDRPSMTENHYFKTTVEMVSLFKDIPEAINNTRTIAQRCFVRSPSSKPLLPTFPSLDGRDEKEELVLNSKRGLKAKILEINSIYKIDEQVYFSRLDMELKIICKMGFSGYYLIVSDVISWAKSQNIPVGPGRGSGAGSIVAWALDITDLDPLRWGLLFERFLNPERISMPDFDIDFCKVRRDEVISYVQERYGKEKVAQIITFGKLKSRAVLRDTGRVLEMPYSQVDKIAKLVPNNPARPLTIAQALEEVEEFREVQQNDEQVAALISISQKLEGLYRHASTHAAGVVIGHRKISEIVPLYKDPKSDIPATQFNMKWVEKAGLVKFDFLGLETLTVISETIKLVEVKQELINIKNLPLNDTKTYKMLSRGETLGVFQLESGGMREVLKGMQPDRFEDLIAIVALYRPGPMENIPTYIARKHGAETVDYMHPELETILKETYGILIYQEQVQQSAQILSGYSLGAADILRRAMGKKIKSEMDSQRERFVLGASNKGIAKKLANSIFDQISAFAGYGFNKSHAAAYAMITYQTAWLRAHYPHEFFSASMSLEINNTDKLADFIIEVKSQNIQLKMPNINTSEVNFEVCEDKHNGTHFIEYGLSAIKNVGANATLDLTLERSKKGIFLSIEDFSRRLPSSMMNKRMLEHLIKAGALDCLNKNRKKLLFSIDNIISFCDMNKRESLSNQIKLFDIDEMENLKVRLLDVDDFSISQKLKYEHSALGLYLSSHPMDAFNGLIKNFDVTISNQIVDTIKSNGGICRMNLAGIVSNIQIRTSKRGNKFAIVSMTDSKGAFEFLVFSEIFSSSIDLLNSEASILVSVDAKMEDSGRIRLSALEIKNLENEVLMVPEIISFRVKDLSAVDNLKTFLEDVPEGFSRIKLFLKNGHEEYEVNLDEGFFVDFDQRERLKAIPGVQLINN